MGQIRINKIIHPTQILNNTFWNYWYELKNLQNIIILYLKNLQEYN